MTNKSARVKDVSIPVSPPEPGAIAAPQALDVPAGSPLDEELPLLGDGPVAFAEGESAIIEGQIEELIFRNEREGFTVASFRLADGRAISAVGPLAAAVVGLPLIVSGTFERDPRFGLQFHIVETLDPQVSEEVAQAYLSSGLIPYVGAAGAAEIVAAAGSGTLRMLAIHPESLTDYRGITPRRLPAIRRALRETLPLASVVGLLGLAVERAQADGREARKLSLRAAKRIHRRYGASASEIIRANPWRMAKEIAGVGFRSADNVAIGLGCPPDSPTRLEAAVLDALRTAAVEEGHIVYPGSVLEADTVRLAVRPVAEARAAIERLTKSGEILHITKPEGYALPRLAEAESLIAAKLRMIVAFADANPIVVSEADIDEIERNENKALSDFSHLSDTSPTAVSSPSGHYVGTPSVSATGGLASAPAPSATAPLSPMERPDTASGVFHFDVSQRRAIRRALEDRVTIITGQPGTGKTTLVRAILDLADDHGLSSALVSPTGRAAKRLSEATGRPAQTIHRWLRYHPDEGFRGPEKLPDVLVVDEVSMLDSPLAAQLFGALPPFVRLILVGDEDQLPAVGPGNVLGDLLGAPAVNVLRLSTIHRTASGSGIPDLARQIRIGVRKPIYDHVTTRFIARGDDPTMKPAEQAAAIAAWIAETAERYKDRIDEFQVLCPMRKTACGTEALNKLIQGIVNPGPHERSIRREGFDLCPGDRILVTENDYENNLFNGDVGKLLDITPEGHLVASFDGVERVLPPDAGGGFILAYAMSIHRAQGSEFPIVIIPMSTSFFKMLQRRLLYTAVSRARSTVAIVGQQKAVSIAIGTHDPRARRTLLLDYLTSSSAPAMPVLAPSDVPEDELF